MANENEDIKKEGENTGEHKHHTWLGDMIEKIEEKIDNIDADFPLSGAEESLHIHHHTPKTEEEIAEEAKKAEEKKRTFLDGLSKEFPLSGGE